MEANKFQPVHPGEILLEEFMLPAGLTVAHLAVSVGVQTSELDSLLDGEIPITESLAHALARVWNTTAAFWMNLQRAFDARSASPNGAAFDAT